MPPEPAEIEEFEVAELLGSLVDKSLAVFDDASGRYRMIETVRQYAWDRLEEIDSTKPARYRHLAYFECFARCKHETMLDGNDPDQRWNEELATEQDNIRSAMQWSLGDVDRIESGFHLAAALQCYWIARARSREEARWLEAALDISKGDPTFRLTTARASIQYWWARYFIGEMEGAIDGLEECLAECREVNDLFGIGRALHGLGLLQAENGQEQIGRESLAEAVARAEEASDKYGLATLLNDMGEFERAHGNNDTAREYYRRSIASCIDWNPAISTFAIANLGSMAAVEGDTNAATRLLIDGLSNCLRFGYEKPAPGCITAVALLISRDRPHDAARLIGAAEAFYELSGTRIEAADFQVYEKARAAVLERLTTKQYENAKSEGSGMDWKAAAKLVLEAIQDGL